MAIVPVLVESTPHRLRYLVSQNGFVTSPPAAVDGFVVIPNDVGGGTPNLDTDASAGPLQEIIKTRLNGYPPNSPSGAPIQPAGALTQAQARALMNSDDNASAVLTNDLVGRAVVEVTPRTGTIAWSVDVNVDAEGDPVVEVRSAVGVVADAYVDIHFRHTYDL